MAEKKTKAIEKKAAPPAVQVQQWLTQRSDKLAEWCVRGSGLDPETLIRVGARCVAMNDKFHSPKTWNSLYIALITAAQLGLEPEGPRGEAYLIPYWDKKAQCHLVQIQPGYRGLMKLITQSGTIKTIRSQVVHANDHFEMQLGTNKRVDHRPAWKDRGGPVAVYSIATYADGDEDYELASWDDVMKAKNSAKGKSPAWDNWPEQMARKFVIKRHSNQLPLDPVARQAVAIDNIDSDTAAADAQEVIDAEIVEETPSEPEKPAPKKDATALEKKAAARKARKEAAAKKAAEAKQQKKAASKEKAKAEPTADPKPEEAPAETREETPPPPDPGDEFRQCELCGEPAECSLCDECEESVRENEKNHPE